MEMCFGVIIVGIVLGVFWVLQKIDENDLAAKRSDPNLIFIRCFYCNGSGKSGEVSYGTNGVEIWPIYEPCHYCKGKGGKFIKRNV